MVEPSPAPLRAGDVEAITPSSSQALYWRLRHLAPSPILGYVPFVFWLVENITPKITVSLGLGTGVPYFAVCQAVEKLKLGATCIAVEPDAEAIDETAKAHNDQFYAEFSNISVTDLRSAARRITAPSIDLLLVNMPVDDALTEIIDVHWLPLLSPTATVLFCAGPAPGFEDKYHAYLGRVGNGSGIFAFGPPEEIAVVLRGPGHSERLRRLTELQMGQPAYRHIRQVFTRLGETYVQTSRLRVKTAEAKRSREMRDEALDKVKEHVAEVEALTAKLGETEELLAQRSALIASLQVKAFDMETMAGEKAESEARMKAAVASNREALDAAHARIETLSAEHEDFARRRGELEDQVARERTALNEARAQVGVAESKLADAEARCVELEAAAVAQAADVAAGRDREAALTAELDDRDAARKAADDDYAARLDEAAAAAAVIADERDALATDLARAIQDIELERAALLDNAAAERDIAVQEAREREDNLAALLRDSEAAHTRMIQDLGAERELALQAARQREDSLAAQLRDSEQALAALRDEHATTLKIAMDAATVTVEERDALAAELAAAIAAAESEYAALLTRTEAERDAAAVAAQVREADLARRLSDSEAAFSALRDTLESQLRQAADAAGSLTAERDALTVQLAASLAALDMAQEAAQQAAHDRAAVHEVTLTAQAAAFQASLDGLQRGHDRVVDDLNAAALAVTTERDALSVRLKGLEVEAEQSRQAADLAAGDAERTRQEVAALQQAHADHETAAAARQSAATAEIEALTGRLASLDGELTLVRTELNDSRLACALLLDESASQKSWIADLEALVDDHEKSAEAALADHDAARAAERAESERRHDALAADIVRLRDDLAIAEATLSEARNDLAERSAAHDGEITRLTGDRDAAAVAADEALTIAAGQLRDLEEALAEKTATAASQGEVIAALQDRVDGLTTTLKSQAALRAGQRNPSVRMGFADRARKQDSELIEQLQGELAQAQADLAVAYTTAQARTADREALAADNDALKAFIETSRIDVEADLARFNDTLQDRDLTIAALGEALHSTEKAMQSLRESEAFDRDAWQTRLQQADEVQARLEADLAQQRHDGHTRDSDVAALGELLQATERQLQQAIADGVARDEALQAALASRDAVEAVLQQQREAAHTRDSDLAALGELLHANEKQFQALATQKSREGDTDPQFLDGLLAAQAELKTEIERQAADLRERDADIAALGQLLHDNDKKLQTLQRLTPAAPESQGETQSEGDSEVQGDVAGLKAELDRHVQLLSEREADMAVLGELLHTTEKQLLALQFGSQAKSGDKTGARGAGIAIDDAAPAPVSDDRIQADFLKLLSVLGAREKEVAELTARLAAADGELRSLRESDAGSRDEVAGLAARLRQAEGKVQEREKDIAALGEMLHNGAAEAMAAKKSDKAEKSEKVTRAEVKTETKAAVDTAAVAAAVPDPMPEVAEAIAVVATPVPPAATPAAASARTLAGRKAEIAALLSGSPFAKSVRDAQQAFNEEAYVVVRSGLFDIEWYRRNYPDVTGPAMAVINDFVRFKTFEGRNPSPYFDTMRYYLDYPDVVAAGLCALSHYITRGKAEGRTIYEVGQQPA